jgi:hypothetical protein
MDELNFGMDLGNCLDCKRQSNFRIFIEYPDGWVCDNCYRLRHAVDRPWMLVEEN